MMGAGLINGDKIGVWAWMEYTPELSTRLATVQRLYNLYYSSVAFGFSSFILLGLWFLRIAFHDSFKSMPLQRLSQACRISDASVTIHSSITNLLAMVG